MPSNFRLKTEKSETSTRPSPRPTPSDGISTNVIRCLAGLVQWSKVVSYRVIEYIIYCSTIYIHIIVYIIRSMEVLRADAWTLGRFGRNYLKSLRVRTSVQDNVQDTLDLGRPHLFRFGEKTEKIGPKNKFPIVLHNNIKNDGFSSLHPENPIVFWPEMGLFLDGKNGPENGAKNG